MAAPADKEATNETKMLYQNMIKLMDKGVMYGHQDDLAYGVGWKAEDARSDVKSVTGSYPAVYGWELGHLELDSPNNIVDVPFINIISYIKEVYRRGGVNTICWHITDPVSGNPALSASKNSVRLILQDKKYQLAYKADLDKVAGFMYKLKGNDGELIPIIFRPFHECSGDWFWWGTSECTNKEYIDLWRMTVDYLVKEKHLHNLLFAYSTADFYSEASYLQRYPGDDYVDIMGFDAYNTNAKMKFDEYLANRFEILNRLSLEHLKIPALTELGYNGIPDNKWWTRTLLPVISAYRLSYMLSWRNWTTDHYFSPYPGQVSADDFKVFFKDPVTLFQDDLKATMYKKALK